jgi:hypothetical protein
MGVRLMKVFLLEVPAILILILLFLFSDIYFYTCLGDKLVGYKPKKDNAHYEHGKFNSSTKFIVNNDATRDFL